LGLGFIYESATWIYTAAKLKWNRQEIQATVINVQHRVEVEDESDSGQGGGPFDVFDVEYVFDTHDGTIYKGEASLFDNPVEGLNTNEFNAKYPFGFQADSKDQIPLKVEYDKSDPNSNRAVEDRNTSLVEVSVTSIIVGVVCIFLISGGFMICKTSIKELRA